MGLDRDSIVRRDFPTNRRGYDPAAVEAHLTALAEEVEALRRRAEQPPSASEQAAEQVRAIVQAAERGADEIRAKASAEAADRVAGVTEAAERLRARVEQMDSDVTHAMSELREEARRLCDDLGAVREAAARLGAASEAAPPEAAVAASAPAPPTVVAEPPRDEAAPREEAAPSPPAAAAAPEAAPRNGDVAAARIVALDMALSGKPREETERFLAEHYDVEDRAGLLDEVYAAAGA